MSNRKIIFASALVAAGMATPVLADTAGELEVLKARLAQLEAQQDKVDGAIAQSQAIDTAVIDASKRQFLLLDGMTGYDGGFKIGSSDGNYVLQPYAEFQFRNVTNYTEGGGDDEVFGDDDELQNGFEIRRMKIGFKGNIVDKKLKYNFRMNFDRDGGESTIDLAYLTYELSDQMTVKAGQFKSAVFHEESMSDMRQLAAERSLTNFVLGGGQQNFVQGVALAWGEEDAPLHAEVAYIDGEASDNTTYVDGDENFGVTARVDYKLGGNWKNYGDFTAKGTDEEDLFVIGGGGSWTQGGDEDIYRATVDAQWENTGGLSVYGAALIAHDDEADATDWGLIAQVGYMLPDSENWEVFGRGSSIFTEADEEFWGEDQYWEFNVGVNKYFSGHNAKFTLDAGWLPEGSPTGAGGLGITDSDEDQFYVRAQIQLVI